MLTSINAHSDRGSQCHSNENQALINEHGLRCGMNATATTPA